MTKTLDQQVRLWPSVDDESNPFADKMFGDGAALHSAIAHDLYRNVNNLQTFGGDQCFQFAFPGSLGARWTKTEDFTSSGEVFLGQLPLIIPHDAIYLRWTIGLRRKAVGELAIAMDVSNLHFFVAAAPCTSLDEDLMLDRSGFTFLAERVVSVNATSSGGGSIGAYNLVLDTVPGWANPIANIPGLQDITETPIFWGIFSADITNAATDGESLDLEEFSFWGAYG